MNFRDTIEGYIKEKNSNSRRTYAPRINLFANFLQNEKEVGDKNFKEYLSAINTDIILEALNSYITNNLIKKETVAYFYARTIKDYFYYLNEIGIENEHLMKEFGYKNNLSYEKKITKFVESNPNLEKVEPKSPLDVEEIKILIAAIDEKIDYAINNPIVDTCNRDKCNPFNDLAYFWVLKVMIFTGIEYSGLRILEENCLDEIRRKITINTYTLHLPDNLGEQLIEYVNIKRKRLLKTRNFFVLSGGKELALQTRKLSEILDEIIGRQDITGLRKYVIIEMIRKGINQSFIMKLTGVGSTVFEDCQRIVNKERHVEANRYIDSKMRDMVLFDCL